MRCLFQIALSDNAEIAEQLLDQIRDLAEESKDVRLTVSFNLYIPN